MMVSNSGGTTFEQPPTGAHIARCVRFIDIGTQKCEYQGEPTMKHQFVLGWELPNELMENGEFQGKPFMVSKFYTASLHEKAALRKDLAAWRTRDFTEEELQGFDVKNLLGKLCMVSIQQNDKGKSKVGGVMALPKGISAPEQINKSVYFTISDFDEDVFNSLSDGYKKLIMQSPEFKRMRNPAAASTVDDKPAAAGNDSMDDDIPF
jgi:hypothetical protein